MYTTKQAATKLGYEDSNIRKLIKAGKIKATRFGAKSWMISETELKRVKAERELKKMGRQLSLA